MPFEHIINNLDPISLEEMDHVKLMRRRDTKFVLAERKLASILELVKDKYSVLEIDGQRIHQYHTLYYDTPAFDMYQNHNKGMLNRYKVRLRKYVSSDISFLEVKFKNNKRETIKKRIRPENDEEITGEKAKSFLIESSPYSADEIKPALQNNFKRITLVHKTIPERITIDIELSFCDAEGIGDLSIPNISIIEVKRDRDSSQSDIITALRKNNIRSMGFSKYCMGTALINPKVKTNLFRNRMRRLAQLNKSYISEFK